LPDPTASVSTAVTAAQSVSSDSKADSGLGCLARACASPSGVPRNRCCRVLRRCASRSIASNSAASITVSWRRFVVASNVETTIDSCIWGLAPSSPGLCWRIHLPLRGFIKALQASSADRWRFLSSRHARPCATHEGDVSGICRRGTASILGFCPALCADVLSTTASATVEPQGPRSLAHTALNGSVATPVDMIAVSPPCSQ